MRRWLVVVAVALVFPVAAQNMDAPMPSGQANTIYAHGEASDGEVMWMNADAADPDATDTANGPGYTDCSFETVPQASGPACTADGEAGVGVTGSAVEAIQHTFTTSLQPSLPMDVPLIPGDVAFTVYLGANSGQGSGTIVARLLNNGDVVAETAPFEFSYDSGYAAFEASATPTVGALTAGDLTWEIAVDGQASGLFLGIHDSTGKSRFTMPLADVVVADVLFHDVDDVELRADFSWNASSEAHQYNWTQGPGAASLAVTGNVTGNVSITVVDAGNATLYNGTVAGTQTTALNGTAGNWTLTVIADNVTGNLSVLLAMPAVDAIPNGAQESDDALDNTTVAPKDKGSPAAPALLALVAVAGLVARRRW